MTLLQMKVIVLTAELGTISSAARALNISQPNASSCIKNCEDEVGFQVFIREKNGAKLTKKGEILFRHAKLIIEESDKIHQLKDHDDYFRLKVGSLNHHLMFNPFLKMVGEHQQDKYIDAAYRILSVDEGLAALTSHQIDLVVIPSLPAQINPLKAACEKANVSYRWLCNIPSCIMVRKNHPAALDGRCSNLSPGSDAMKDYPYIAYHNFHQDDTETNYHDESFVQAKYTIIIDDADSRQKLLAKTDAFAFGIQQPKEYLDAYGLTSFVVPNYPLFMFALTRNSDIWHREIDDYISLLLEEFEEIRIKD